MSSPIQLTDELLHEALRLDGVATPPDLADAIKAVVAAEPRPGRAFRVPGLGRMPLPGVLVWLVVVVALAAALAVGAVLSRPRGGPLAVIPTPSPAPAVVAGPSPSALPLVSEDVWALRAGDGIEANGGLEAAGSLWLSNAGGNEILRVDPTTREAVRIGLRDPSAVAGTSRDVPLAWDGSQIWAGIRNLSSFELVAVDPTMNTVTRRIAVTVEPYRLAAAPGRAWVTDYALGNVLAIDLASGETTATRDLPEAAGVAFDGERLYLCSRPGELMEVDPATLEGAPGRTVAEAVMTLRIGGDRIYIARNAEVGVSFVPVDLSSPSAEISGPAHGGLALLDGDPWITDWEGDTLQRLDPETLTPVESIELGVTNEANVMAADGTLWVVGLVEGQPVLRRIAPSG
jgi:hypothetical protein